MKEPGNEVEAGLTSRKSSHSQYACTYHTHSPPHSPTGDYIVYAGDMGREMYCVRRGLVEVIGDDEITVVATLGPGGYFGEVQNVVDLRGTVV